MPYRKLVPTLLVIEGDLKLSTPVHSSYVYLDRAVSELFSINALSSIVGDLGEKRIWTLADDGGYQVLEDATSFTEVHALQF